MNEAPDNVKSLSPAAEGLSAEQLKPKIADHELLRCIGRGAYGEVWLARNVMGAYRAVKIVYRRTFGDDRPYRTEWKTAQSYQPVIEKLRAFADAEQKLLGGTNNLSISWSLLRRDYDAEWIRAMTRFGEAGAPFLDPIPQVLNVVGGVPPNMTSILKAQTLREMAVTAIALRRYQLQNEKSPNALNELVPQFLPRLPIDFMNGRPLQYRLNPDATFSLYSVGDDGTDDNGDAMPPDTKQKYESIWDGRDAVWPNPASAKAADSLAASAVFPSANFFYWSSQHCARNGKWKNAAENLDKILQRKETASTSAWSQRAAFLIEAGDFEQYNQHRSSLLGRWASKSRDSMSACRLVRASLLRPLMNDESRIASNLADIAITKGTNHSSEILFWGTKALSEYRSEQLTSAVAWTEKALNRSENIVARAVRAMAYWRLGDAEKARISLGIAQYNVASLPSLKDLGINDDLTDWIINRAIVREASALIEGSPDSKTARNQREQCLEHLRVLDAARDQWALEYAKNDEAIPAIAELSAFMKEKPICPAGGAYKVGAVKEQEKSVGCSVHGTLEQVLAETIKK